MASYAIVYNGISGSREVSLVIMCAVIRAQRSLMLVMSDSLRRYFGFP